MTVAKIPPTLPPIQKGLAGSSASPASVPPMVDQSAVERVQRALEAAHATQDQLNAFTLIDDEKALERAAEIDRRIAAGVDPGPLAGVPIGLKDLIDHRGRETTCGSAFYRVRARTTATAVQRLEDAGAVVVGRTGLHEFAFGFSSENPHFGPVRNPWDTSTSTGGSSGGSGAAVAAGITPIAIGTDTGGSVRVPAALCGTFGLKVTHGRIPLDGVFPLVPSVDTVGPLADSMENIDLSYRVMSGDGEPEAPSRSHRIGIPQPWVERAAVSDEVSTGFAAAIHALRDSGHHVETVTIEDAYPPGLIWDAIAEEVTTVHAQFRAQGKPYGSDVAARLDSAAGVNADQTAAARAWQAELRARFARAFESLDSLMTPTVPVTKKVIGEDRIEEHHYRAVLSYFTALVNQSLHPALAMPLITGGSPPMSIQLIGPMHSEIGLISMGKRLEAAGIVGFSQGPGWAT